MNGLAEGVDASARAGARDPVGIMPGEPPEVSIGRRLADAGGKAVATAASIAANGAKALYTAFSRT